MNETVRERIEPPAAIARLLKHASGWSWVVKPCLYCGKEHRHGGGGLQDDPYALLGHRWAHCFTPSPDSNSGYILTTGERKG